MYNPFDDINIGGNIAVELISTPDQSLTKHTTRLFEGGGVYALYYKGSCTVYGLHQEGNLTRWGGKFRAVYPIYVGSSFAVGTKKGLQGVRDQQGNRHALAERIAKHSKTITSTKGAHFPLKPQEFRYKAIPMSDVHIGLAEATLITFFRPIWNGLGFGNNTPGAGRPGLKDPNPFSLLHKPSTKGKYKDATRRAEQEVRNAVRIQVDSVSAPDDDLRIEKFMKLLRAELEI